MSHIVGRVHSDAVKQDALTETQLAQLKPYYEQWGDISENIRSQPERWAYMATRKQPGSPFRRAASGPTPPATPSSNNSNWRACSAMLSPTPRRTEPDGSRGQTEDLSPAPLFGN